MKPYLALVTAAFLAMTGAASAHEPAPTTEAYLTQMCTLAGDWGGRIELFATDGTMRAVPFDVRFDCHPGEKLLMETNVFHWDEGDAPTLKVIYPDAAPSGMKMTYFFGGTQADFGFAATELERTDADHWRAARTSLAPKTEHSRYIHIRDGDNLTMLREVRPLDGSAGWRLSSQLLLERSK